MKKEHRTPLFRVCAYGEVVSYHHMRSRAMYKAGTVARKSDTVVTVEHRFTTLVGYYEYEIVRFVHPDGTFQ